MASQFEDDTTPRFENIPLHIENIRYNAELLPMDESEDDGPPPMLDSEVEADKLKIDALAQGRESRRVKKDASKLVEEEKNFDEILSKLSIEFANKLKIDGADLKNTIRAILDKTANLEMRQCIEGGSSVNDAIRQKIAEIHIKIQKIIDYFKQNPHLINSILIKTQIISKFP